MDIYLIYHSKAQSELSRDHVLEILIRARLFNSENNITGCLLHYNDEFLQILEGDSYVVDDLYARIQSDPRHSNVTTIQRQVCRHRYFKDWDMAYGTTTRHPMDIITKHLDIVDNAKADNPDMDNMAYKLFCALGDSIMLFNDAKQGDNIQRPSVQRISSSD